MAQMNPFIGNKRYEVVASEFEFEHYDTNNDKRITIEEFTRAEGIPSAEANDFFIFADLNGDGFVDTYEFKGGPLVFTECIFASLPRTERGKPIQLGQDPKGNTFLYFNGNNVYMRNIQVANECEIYGEHASAVNVAKYAPSGNYICSGDKTGKVRVWATDNPERPLKNEYSVLGGDVRDIQWDSESKRLAIVGGGGGSFGKCITMDSGNTVGELSGHAKAINCVAYRQIRPYRVATASEDMCVHFYEGPPFKYKHATREHTNFVNCIRYQPSKAGSKDDVYISGGADGKALLYNGNDGTFIGGLGGDKAHKAGIYALEFSDDGKEVLTVSADKTAKIWNVESRECVVEFVFGTDILDMQVGCLWSGDNIMTVSLSGYINYLDRNNPTTPLKILKGHNKSITAMAVTPDKCRIITGDTTGEQIYVWDAATGLCDDIKGKGHTNKIQEMVLVQDTLISVSMDDTIRYTCLTGNQYGSTFIALPSQPSNVAATCDRVSVVTCINHLVVVDRDCNIVFQQEVKFEPTCVDIYKSTVAIGGKNDKTCHIFTLDGGSLTGVQRINVGDEVTDVKFSPDGEFLVVTTANTKNVKVLKAKDKYEELWSTTKQTGKLLSIAWNPEAPYFATSSLDGSIAVWCLESGFGKMLKCFIKDAHKKSQVNKVQWLDHNTLVTIGSDSCVNQFTVNIV